MLTEFVLPKVPKDFSETTMAKKTYLIASANGRHSMNSPASMGIRRLDPPSDLDVHLVEVFTKQEDERYRLKLRHQVERVSVSAFNYLLKSIDTIYLFFLLSIGQINSIT